MKLADLIFRKKPNTFSTYYIMTEYAVLRTDPHYIYTK